MLYLRSPTTYMGKMPTLKQQEIPLDHPDSNNMFRPSREKPFVATATAIEMYSNAVIVGCWQILQELADEQSGLDYLQVFESDDHDENLWYIEVRRGTARLIPFTERRSKNVKYSWIAQLTLSRKVEGTRACWERSDVLKSSRHRSIKVRTVWRTLDWVNPSIQAVIPRV
jgi:hypothetical protein